VTFFGCDAGRSATAVVWVPMRAVSSAKGGFTVLKGTIDLNPALWSVSQGAGVASQALSQRSRVWCVVRSQPPLTGGDVDAIMQNGRDQLAGSFER
jgi:hypothetical protein